MASDEYRMTPDNLKSNMFDAAFGNNPHKFYVVYDDLMDELVIKVTRPDTLVAEFPISDRYSLLVEPTTFEVVGLQLSEFTTEHLPKLTRLSQIWTTRNLSQFFGEYREIDYKPQEPKSQPAANSYFFVRPAKLDSVLAAA